MIKEKTLLFFSGTKSNNVSVGRMETDISSLINESCRLHFHLVVAAAASGGLQPCCQDAALHPIKFLRNLTNHISAHPHAASQQKEKKTNKTLWQGKAGMLCRARSHSRLIGRINLSGTAAVEPAAPLRLALDIFLVFTPKSAGKLSPEAEALKLQPFKTKRTKKWS